MVGSYNYTNGQTNEGVIYLFYGSAAGLSVSPDWMAEGDQVSAFFGYSVNGAGDVNGDVYSDVIVGAYGSGKAYVWYGSASGLGANGNPTNADWTVSDSSALGYSVNTAGDVNGDGYDDIVIGDYLYNDSQVNDGRAYVWYGSSTGLHGNGTPSGADWQASSEYYHGFLGYSVASAGDVNGDGYDDLIAGAPGYGSTDNSGAVFVWYGSGSGLGATGTTANADWLAQSDQDGSQLGFSVSSAGDVNGDGYADISVAATSYDNGQIDEGKVFVWYGSGSGLGTTGTPANADWSVEHDTASENLTIGSHGGGDINGDGYADLLVNSGPYGAEGQVWAYYGSASGLGATGTLANADWTKAGDAADNQFGTDIAFAGDVNGDGFSDVIVGSESYGNGQSNEGRATVFYGSAENPSTTPNTKTEGNTDSVYYGENIINIGDVNGDGYQDAAYVYAGNQVKILYGSSTGIPSVASYTLSNSEKVSAAGDVNGDGDDDIIVKSTTANTIYIYYGGFSGINSGDRTAITGPASSGFGNSLKSAGDVNGDGYADIIVGAPQYNHGSGNEGAAYVYYGATPSIATSPAWQYFGSLSGVNFGSNVSSAGDVNNDGYDDIAVSAPFDRTNNFTYDSLGRVYVFYGSASGSATTISWKGTLGVVAGNTGVGLAKGGDINGDLYDDLLIGTPGASSSKGAVSVVLGSVSGLPASGGNGILTDHVIYGTNNNDYFGSNIFGAGDVNNDGLADFIASTNADSNEYVQLYYGDHTSVLSASPIATFNGLATSDGFGVNGLTLGDFNGDTYEDILISAPYYSNGNTNEGALLAYYGNNNSHRAAIRPGQIFNTALMSLGQGISVGDDFDFSAYHSSPLGRTAAGFKAEVKTTTTTFDGSNLLTSTKFNTGASSQGTVTANNLSQAAYHWRARYQYGPLNSYSPWYTLGGDWNETKFKIVNAAPVNVSLTISTSSINETGGSATITAVLNNTPSSNVTVNLVYTGTAVKGTDYAATTTITIPAGSTTGTTVVTSTSDTLYEGNETILVNIDTVVNAVESGVQQVTASIVDDDSIPTVTLSTSTASLSENNASLPITATLSNQTSLPVTVNLVLSGTASGADYFLSSTTINIAPGTSSGFVTLSSIEDLLDEPDETVIIDINTVTNATESGTQQETVTITDNDTPPTVTLNTSSLTFAEGGGTANIEAVLSAVSGQDVTVNLAYSGTATLTSDYTKSLDAIVIPAGSTVATATLTGVEELDDDDDETVIVDIASVTNGTESGTQQLTYTIIDNDDDQTVYLTTSSNNVDEAAGTTDVTVYISAISSKTITINLGVTGSATLNTDYSIATTTLVIPAGSLAATTTVTGIDDLSDDDDETIVIDISSVTGGRETTVQQKTITIIDDDDLQTVYLTADTNTIAEDGTATITATLSAPSSLDIIVDLAYTGTATNNLDYIPSANSISIPHGSTSGSVTISAIDDLLNEDSKTVVVDISSVTNGRETTAQQQIITINDNDPLPTVSLSGPASMLENGGPVQITATLSSISSKNITLNLAYFGTATQPTYYSASSTVINIPAESSIGTVTLVPVNNMTADGNQTIVTHLVSATNATVSGSDLTTNLVDDDATPVVVLSSAPLTISENGGVAVVTSTLSATSSQPVLVNLIFTGTAVNGGVDFNRSSSTISIPAGSLSGSITITAVDNSTVNSDKTVIVDIDTVTNANESGVQTNTITISNDDVPTVTLTQNHATTTETGGVDTLTATLSDVYTSDVTVALAYSGTATRGVDYTAPLSVVVPAGSTSATFSLTNLSDSLVEGSETIIVDISSVLNGTESGTQQLTTTIIDDDVALPTVTLSRDNSAISEAGGVAILTATLSAASSSDVTVNLAYTGSAGNGSDFTAASAITIPAGSLSASINLTAIDDSSVEGSETITVDISTVSNATESGTQQVAISITDNDTSSGGGGGGGSSQYISDKPPVAPGSGFSLSVNNGTNLTYAKDVKVRFNVGPDTAKVSLSNRLDFSGATVVDYTNKDYDWDLCTSLTTCAAGPRNLYAKFYTKYGIPSPAYSVAVLWKDKQEQLVVTPITVPEIITTPAVVTSTSPVGTSMVDVVPVTSTGGFKVCAPAIFDEALRVGALGGNVEKLQYVLKQQGFFKGNITGIFGATTEAAVINFQKAKGIKPASGLVEAKTVKALTALKICQVFEPVIKPKMETKCAKFDKYLYQGISGDQVKRVQDILRYFGYYTDKLTGYYGPVTKKAVGDFQSDAGLLEKMKNPKLDKGRVGPETRKFLNDLFPC